MPELPEVQTTVNGIRALRGLKIVDVWTDYFSHLYENHHQIKNKKFFSHFKKRIVGSKILDSERRAKNVLIHLDNSETILIHMKMTGHLLYGKYKKQKNKNAKGETWKAVQKGPLRDDTYNQFIHLVFVLSNGKHLVLSDVRKFAKATVLKTENLKNEFSKLGPEPLDNSFKLSDFHLRLKNKPNGKIKQVLMDQSVVSGIGNIYSDEILWASGVHPLRKVKDLKKEAVRKIFRNTKILLKKGVRLGGDSLSDYRQINGEKGRFQHEHKAYQRTGEVCKKTQCRGKIKRIIVGGRSTHFCPIHQK